MRRTEQIVLVGQVPMEAELTVETIEASGLRPLVCGNVSFANAEAFGVGPTVPAAQRKEEVAVNPR